MMCEWGNTKPLLLRIPADLSHTGKERWVWKKIDVCIADIVAALQAGGIDMRGSCCGHSSDFGVVILQDGRILSVCKEADYRSFRWAVGFAWQIVRNKYWLKFKRWAQTQGAG